VAPELTRDILAFPSLMNINISHGCSAGAVRALLSLPPNLCFPRSLQAKLPELR
jgi:hypothetical protein